jgi:hypothetical protein
VIVRGSQSSGKSHVGYRLSFVGAVSSEDDDELFDLPTALRQAARRHGAKSFDATAYVFESFAAAKNMVDDCKRLGVRFESAQINAVDADTLKPLPA